MRGLPPVARPRSLIHLPYLQAWRTWRNLFQRELAEQAHVSPTTVVRAEAGVAVTPLTAQKLARVLDVAVLQLREEPPPAEMRWLERRRPDAPPA
jgi:DNA-binding XRE family transcriptional regulator